MVDNRRKRHHSDTHPSSASTTSTEKSGLKKSRKQHTSKPPVGHPEGTSSDSVPPEGRGTELDFEHRTVAFGARDGQDKPIVAGSSRLAIEDAEHTMTDDSVHSNDLFDVPTQRLSGVELSSNLSPSLTSNSGAFYKASGVDARHGIYYDLQGKNNNIKTKITNYHNYEDSDQACLKSLCRARDARFDCSAHKTCTSGTRMQVLQRIEAWEDDNGTRGVYWLKGGSGTGKSTIAVTFAERSASKGRLGATFFCSRDFLDRSNVQLIFPTLAYDLAMKYDNFKTALLPIIRTNADIDRKMLSYQLDTILIQPLVRTCLSTTIVIDALDECQDTDPVSKVLSALAQFLDKIPNVKFFITGRPEDRIRSGFGIASLYTEELPLHDVDPLSVDEDIKTYLGAEMKAIAHRRRHSLDGSPWPSDKEIVLTCRKCSGLFIVAAVITRFVDHPLSSPKDRLHMITSMPESTVYEGKSGIDAMYDTVLATSFKDVSLEGISFDLLNLVLGSIILAFAPLSRTSLAVILETTPGKIWTSLSLLHSIIIVPDSESNPIRICHKSVSDYLTDSERCSDKRFFIESSAHHLDLGTRCLKLMNKKLKKNICNLPSFAMNVDVHDLDICRREYIGHELEYACISWAKHFRSACRTGSNIDNTIGSLKIFFEHHMLSWLEVLSITGQLGVAVYSLRDIRSWINDVDDSNLRLLCLIDDCERFVLYSFDVIEASACHIYHSALLWTPSSSEIRVLYQRHMTAKRVNAIDESWDTWIRRILVPHCLSYDIQFSCSGELIACAAIMGTKVYDALTGVCIATLDGDPLSVSFSPDDTILACGQRDGAVQIWDLQIGNLTNVLRAYMASCYSVAFSPCGTMIATGSDDFSIRI